MNFLQAIARMYCKDKPEKDNIKPYVTEHFKFVDGDLLLDG